MPDSVCYTVKAGEVLEDEAEAAGVEVEMRTFSTFLQFVYSWFA